MHWALVFLVVIAIASFILALIYLLKKYTPEYWRSRREGGVWPGNNYGANGNITPPGSPVAVIANRGGNHYSATAEKNPLSIIPSHNSDHSAQDWFDEVHQNFPRAQIEYIREIGQGWFGFVIEAEALDIVSFAHKTKVIVKVLREDASPRDQIHFLYEAKLYRDSSHPNILKLLGHSISSNPFLLIMESCPDGDLKEFLVQNSSRAEIMNSRGDLIRMALDVAKGLEYITLNGFIHGDLSARNCQVNADNRVVIGDYGNTPQKYKQDYHQTNGLLIPIRWSAPESLHCSMNIITPIKISNKSNVWTFGVVMWEICEMGNKPYADFSDREVISRVLINKSYFLQEPSRIENLKEKGKIVNLMNECWNLNPDQRPTITLIVERLEELLMEIE